MSTYPINVPLNVLIKTSSQWVSYDANCFVFPKHCSSWASPPSYPDHWHSGLWPASNAALSTCIHLPQDLNQFKTLQRPILFNYLHQTPGPGMHVLPRQDLQPAQPASPSALLQHPHTQALPGPHLCLRGSLFLNYASRHMCTWKPNLSFKTVLLLFFFFFWHFILGQHRSI